MGDNINELIKNIEKYVYDNVPYKDIFYRIHVEAVRKYALELASKMNANKTIVEIAALLHDTGKIKDLENHHIESVKIAEKMLTKYKCNKKFIEDVAHCILVHRASEKKKANIIEAQIIKDADGLAFIDIDTGTWLAFLYYMWTERKFNLEDGIKQTEDKIKRMYDKIETDYGRELAKSNYSKLMKLFSFLNIRK